MKRRAFLLIALSLAGLALVALGRQSGAADPPPTAVVVDPGEFVQPVPDPLQGLAGKYDGKVVRYTGEVRKASLDKRTKKHSYEVHFDIVHRVPGKGKKLVVVGKDTVVVTVHFRGEEKELQKQYEKQLRARKPGPTITVQGTGTVQDDGALLITGATLVGTKSPFAKE
jgi:hypothetical protein